MYLPKYSTRTQRSGVLDYPSGIPTSTVDSDQQWDFPNAWSPLQDVVISALTSTGSAEGRNSALTVANNWINSNYLGWKRTKRMFEKVKLIFTFH